MDIPYLRKYFTDTTSSPPAHPYFPADAVIVDYTPNTLSVTTLLEVFGTVAASIPGAAYLGLLNFAPSLKHGDRLTVLWFILCGCLHVFFEGYFVLNHARMSQANNIVSQLWKEYALSDSRYMSSDPIVLCMETLTVVCWGPLSLLVAYLITVQHPLRHSLQAIVSVGHLYGDVLYYATSFFDLYYRQVTYCRPEPYYWWSYFFFMNLPWIVVPSSKIIGPPW